MPYIYAMSDIHAHYDAFLEALDNVDLFGDNKLILLGDYIHGGDKPSEVLGKIISLQRKYGSDKVIVLLGNHEEMFLSGFAPFDEFNPDNDGSEYESFLSSLPLYYTTDYNQVFCHAGIDEEAEEYWEENTMDIDYTEKYPADVLQPGDDKLCVDVIAGHVGTAELYMEYTGERNRLVTQPLHNNCNTSLSLPDLNIGLFL